MVLTEHKADLTADEGDMNGAFLFTVAWQAHIFYAMQQVHPQVI